MGNRAVRWIGCNPSLTQIRMRNNSDWSIKSGNSLEKHTRVAHGGEVDHACPACVEIKAKMAKLK